MLPKLTPERLNLAGEPRLSDQLSAGLSELGRLRLCLSLKIGEARCLLRSSCLGDLGSGLRLLNKGYSLRLLTQRLLKSSPLLLQLRLEACDDLLSFRCGRPCLIDLALRFLANAGGFSTGEAHRLLPELATELRCSIGDQRWCLNGQ